jgi:hypothetical protein
MIRAVSLGGSSKSGGGETRATISVAKETADLLFEYLRAAGLDLALPNDEDFPSKMT